MEYSDLKTIWIQTAEQQSLDYRLSKEDVGNLLDKKSGTVVSRIRARLKLKIWLQSLLGILGLSYSAYLFQLGETMAALLEAVVFLTILFLGIHKIFHYRQIVNFQRSADSLKTSLVSIIGIMNTVIKTQIYSTVFLATLASAMLVLIGLKGQDPLWRASLVAIIAIVSPFLFYLLAKRGQNKIFGQYLETLRDCVGELETAEEDSE